MKVSVRKGFSFGLTSGVITTLGLIVGLHSSTNSTLAVVGGILVIAIADAMSDALGIHISEESENRHTAKEIWESTFTTLSSKFVFALSFIVPIILLPLATAIMASVIWGLLLITVFSFYMARLRNIGPHKIVAEHLVIAILVVFISHYVGELISAFF